MLEERSFVVHYVQKSQSIAMKQNATYIQASIHPEKLALLPQSAFLLPLKWISFWNLRGGSYTSFFSLHTILANDYKQPKRPHITLYTVHCTLNMTNYLLCVWHWPMPLSCRLCLEVLIVLIHSVVNQPCCR